MIEIVYDEEQGGILGCQMASKYDISMGNSYVLISDSRAFDN